MRKNHAITNCALLAATVLTLSLAPRAARAVTDTLTDATSVNAANIKATPPSSDQICGMLISDQVSGATARGNGTDVDGNTKPAAIFGNGQQSWGNSGASPTADQWCSNHGFPTDVGVAAVTGVTGSTAPTGDIAAAVTSGSGCNVPLSPNDGTGAAACKLANLKAMQCKFHGSQLESQCMAYKAATTVNKFQYATLALDIAATGICGVACAARVVGDAGQIACTAAGGGATAMDIAGSLAQKDSNPVVSILGGAMGVAGTSFASMGLANVALDGKITGEASQHASRANDDCWAAGLFAVMSGMRVADIVIANNIKKDADAAVQSLWSSAAVATANADGTSQNPNQVSFNQATGALTPGGPSDTGSGSVSNGNGTSGTTASTCTGTTESTDPTCKNMAAAATDSGILQGSGLDKVAAPLAAALAPNLPAAVSGGAGAAVGSGMPASAGDFGSALTKVADAAQAHAGDLGISGMGGNYGGGGGGGGGKSGGGGDANPFASLFGAAGAKDAARGSATEQFGKPGSPSDIWHTGTSQNIFEIVSDKMTKVAGRIGTR